MDASWQLERLERQRWLQDQVGAPGSLPVKCTRCSEHRDASVSSRNFIKYGHIIKVLCGRIWRSVGTMCIRRWVRGVNDPGISGLLTTERFGGVPLGRSHAAVHRTKDSRTHSRRHVSSLYNGRSSYKNCPQPRSKHTYVRNKRASKVPEARPQTLPSPCHDEYRFFLYNV